MVLLIVKKQALSYEQKPCTFIVKKTIGSNVECSEIRKEM